MTPPQICATAVTRNVLSRFEARPPVKSDPPMISAEASASTAVIVRGYDGEAGLDCVHNRIGELGSAGLRGRLQASATRLNLIWVMPAEGIS